MVDLTQSNHLGFFFTFRFALRIQDNLSTKGNAFIDRKPIDRFSGKVHGMGKFAAGYHGGGVYDSGIGLCYFAKPGLKAEYRML